MKHSQVFIAFVDCVVDGGWKPIRVSPGLTALAKEALNDDDCTIAVLQINQVRKYLHFKKNSQVDFVGTVIIYNNEDLKEELSIDEYQQLRKKNDSWDLWNVDKE